MCLTKLGRWDYLESNCCSPAKLRTTIWGSGSEKRLGVALGKVPGLPLILHVSLRHPVHAQGLLAPCKGGNASRRQTLLYKSISAHPSEQTMGAEPYSKVSWGWCMEGCRAGGNFNS